MKNDDLDDNEDGIDEKDDKKQKKKKKGKDDKIANQVTATSKEIKEVDLNLPENQEFVEFVLNDFKNPAVLKTFKNMKSLSLVGQNLNSIEVN